MDFKIKSDFVPTGDQPTAIKQLVSGLQQDVAAQTLLGVTGSGKTFTIANVVEKVNRPTLVLSHNKTLAAQLYAEFKAFFPENAVEYFVSYYDYYQPEAYLPTTNTYIEKDLSINDEIEKLRISTTSSLLSGRRDVIVVSSVSCIYGIGNPSEFYKNVINVKIGEVISRNKFLTHLVESLYSRTEAEFVRGNFRVKGDTVDVYPAYADYGYRIGFWGDEIETLERFEIQSGKRIESIETLTLYPANLFVTSKDTMRMAMEEIRTDMGKQVEFLKSINKHLEAKRIEDRVTYDLEMMQELGYCSGIENYSRYFDRRQPGERPFCLMDYFPEDFLMVIDESHVTISQIKAMYGGDRARKQNLVEYGFRLPAAMDNRPLKFEEFETMLKQVIYVSATPAEYELERSEGVIVEQLIRPTGLLDPLIEVRPSANQIDDLLHEIDIVTKRDERTLITTLTKRMAEELAKFLANSGIRCRYIHSDIDTIERVEILADLRKGIFDVLIGINLLREGLDLPEVSFIAILDADKEGFLRSERAMVQIVGRAARNLNGRVVMYADKMTDSMKKTIDETARRRQKQIAYNLANGITPMGIKKTASNSILGTSVVTSKGKLKKVYTGPEEFSIAADPVLDYLPINELEILLKNTKAAMMEASKKLEFMEAARLRDELLAIEKIVEKRKA